MTGNTNYYKHKVEGNVDLGLISKYHNAVQVEIDQNERKNINEYDVAIDLIIRTIKREESEEYHYAYDYLDIDETLLPENHSINLLYLVHSLIRWEWVVYNEDILDSNKNKDYYNEEPGKYDLAKGLKQDLQDLILLMDAQRDVKPEDIKITLSVPVKTLSGKFPSKLEIKTSQGHIIWELVNAKFNEVRNNYGFYMPQVFNSMKEPIYQRLVELHSELTDYNFQPEKALNLFRKLVVEKVLAYLNGENISKTPEKEDVTTEQARIIYTLLAVFNLLSTKDHIDKHITERSRTKYIRSIIQSPRNNRIHSYRQTSKIFPELKLQIKK